MSRIKELFRKYGKTAVAVHFAVYFSTFGGAMCREMGLLQAKRVWDHAFPHAAHAYLALVPHLPSTACYMAVEHGRVDVEGKMVDWGLLRARSAAKEDDRQGWMATLLAGKGSSAAVAFLCTKALMPIRAGVTFTATPLLHRWLTGRAAVTAAAREKELKP